MRSVLQEIKELYDSNVEARNEPQDQARAAMLLRHTTLERNKRCLLAYLNHRVEKIRDMRWEFGPVLPADVKVSTKIGHLWRGMRVFNLARITLLLIS